MPLLCRAPEELTSINVVRGLLDSLSVVIGPFVAALLVTVADVASVFVFAGVCGMVSAVLVLGLSYERLGAAAAGRANWSPRCARGCTQSGGTAASRLSSSSWCCSAVIRGAFTVLVVVVSIDLLDAG